MDRDGDVDVIDAAILLRALNDAPVIDSQRRQHLLDAMMSRFKD